MLVASMSACARAQTPLTRLGLVSSVVEARRQYFEQPVILDGCSLATMIDSISSGMGALDPAFASLVQGTSGRCLDRADLPGPQIPRVLSFMLAIRAGAEMADPRMAAADRERVFSVLLVVQNPNNQTSHTEQWVLQPSPDGKLAVVAVRISPPRAH
jgi:hypothetical protein